MYTLLKINSTSQYTFSEVTTFRIEHLCVSEELLCKRMFPKIRMNIDQNTLCALSLVVEESILVSLCDI